MIDDVYFSDGPFYFISIPRRDRPNKVIISPLILTHSSAIDASRVWARHDFLFFLLMSVVDGFCGIVLILC